MSARLDRLPIDDVLDELERALDEHPNAVVVAPPGAGKTTRVPWAIAKRAVPPGKRVVLLQPRRVAARAVARRIARERGVTLGGEVGYQVRFDRKWRDETSLVVVTEGILTAWLQRDPTLEEIGAVVFDEFHERSLHADLAIALTRQVQRELRPELRLVVMSATLDAEAPAAFLGRCPIIESKGRTYPVETEHEPADERHVAEAAAAAASRLIADGASGVLVFMPGKWHIDRTLQALRPHARTLGFESLPLHGSLRSSEQDRALSPSESPRVVVATNIAETSLTVPDVTAVVDSGLAKRPMLDPGTGIDRLETIRISRASADQRCGRAGRVAPGRCVRLWSRFEDERLDEAELPEIRRLDLTGTILQLLVWGERDPHTFDWYESPGPDAIDHALTTLEALGAVGEQGVTETGRAMTKLPVATRLARALVEAHRLGAVRWVAIACAILSNRDPFPRRRDDTVYTSDSDVGDRVEAVLDERDRRIDRGTRARLLREARAIERSVKRHLGRHSSSDEAPGVGLRRCLLPAFQDRLAKRRAPGSRRAVMVGGKGIQLDESSAVRNAELFVVVDLSDGGRRTGADALARMVSAVDEAWLDNERFEETSEVRFDAEAGRVVVERVRSYDDLELERHPSDERPAAEIEARLAEALAAQPSRWLDFEDSTVATYIARRNNLAEWMPELEIPSVTDEVLASLAPRLCMGCRTMDAVAGQPLVQILGESLSHAQRQAIDEHAPTHLTIPTGRSARLEWAEGKPPILAARIQELFGLATTPRVAAGRVAVVVHLLAPNGRPQQVTTDLENFWATTYFDVRKALRARYPKHAWPEDPLSARPESRPGRRH